MSFGEFIKNILVGPEHKRQATRAKREAADANLGITDDELEAHALSGGHVVTVVRAMKRARDLGVELSFQRAAAMDIVGRDIEKAVEESHIEREMEFDRIGNDKSQVIEGNCRDGTAVHVYIKLRYKLGCRVVPFEDHELPALQEGIALRSLLAIGKAESITALRLTSVETMLRLYASEGLPDLTQLEVRFEQV